MSDSPSRRPTKLLFVVYAIDTGGGSRATLDLVLNLRGLGYQCDIFCGFGEGALVTEARAAGVNVISHYSGSGAGPLRALRRAGFVLARLLRIARQYDVLIASGETIDFFFTALVARLYRRRGIAIVRNMLSTSLKSYGWSGPLHELIARVAFRKLDAVVAISIAVEEMLREDYHIPPSRLKLIPSGISVSRLERLAAEQPSLPASELPRVVAASRIVYHKGFDTLIDAHLCAFPVIPHELIIVGDGEELSALIARGATGGSIHFTGRLANPYPLMKSATVVCVPSRWEARGIVPIESLMLGLNVIATDCPGGLAETMGHGDFGDLVPPDDPAALAEALLRCLRTPDSLAAKTRAGRQFHRDQSSVAATGRAFSVLLDELESR